MTQCYP